MVICCQTAPRPWAAGRYAADGEYIKRLWPAIRPSGQGTIRKVDFTLYSRRAGAKLTAKDMQVGHDSALRPPRASAVKLKSSAINHGGTAAAGKTQAEEPLSMFIAGEYPNDGLMPLAKCAF